MALAQLEGTFSLTGQLTTVRTDHTATLLANGKVLVAGGWATVTQCPDALDLRQNRARFSRRPERRRIYTTTPMDPRSKTLRVWRRGSLRLRLTERYLRRSSGRGNVVEYRPGRRPDQSTQDD
jgi:hypothetical protein